jgi:hypothetical protein
MAPFWPPPYASSILLPPEYEITNLDQGIGVSIPWRACRCPMRVERLVGVLVLLVAVATGSAFAQSSTTSGQTQSQSSSQATNQSSSSSQNQPVSPLQDQPTGIAAEQQAQANSQKSGQLSQFETPNGSQQDQELGEIRLMTRYTQIGGDPSRSFLDPGLNDLAEINYFRDHSFLGTTFRLQSLAMFRATDDYSIDPEKTSIQKIYFRFYNPRDEYIVGDALVNYSRLTFNQNIKGVSASWLLGSHWKLSMVGGVFTDRWGSFYKDLPGRPYVANVAGSRLAFTPSRNLTIGANFAFYQDIVSTLPAEPIGTTPQPASNLVGSVDFRYQLKNFRLNGEFAYSSTDFDERGQGLPCPIGTDASGNVIYGPCNSNSPQPQLGFQGDWGGLAEGNYRWHKFTLRGSFVRFEPNFAALNARQIADLQDLLIRPGYDLTNFLEVDGTMRYTINDLKEQLPYRTTLWGPEGRLMFHDLPFYRRMVLEVGYRDRMVNSSNYSGPISVTGQVDSYIRGPWAEITAPIKTTYLTFGYERRDNVDYVNPQNTSNTNRFYIGWRGVYDWGGWHINPGIRWELERQSQEPFLNYNPVLATLEYNSNRLDTISLIVEPPKWFIIELGFRDASATITSATETLPPLYYPSGYSRPSYRAQVTYKYRNDENKLVIFTFERNNNYYYTSNNFDERVAGVTLVWKFGKRGR